MKKYNPITKKWEDTDEVLIDKYGEKIQKALYAKNSMDKYDPEKYEVVKGTNIKKSWFNNWFKTPKTFEDGYDFGDVTKTILGTGGKVATEFTRGILNIGEGIGDTINYGISWGADKLGAHEFAENLKNETKKDLFNSYLKPNDEIYGKNSITDSKTDNIVNSLGYMYGLYATAGLGSTTASQTAISTAVTFESSYGHALSEAYNAGASDKDARRYALISASAEAGSELMFGGIGKGSKAIGISRSAIPVDDKIAKFASDRFKSTFAKNLTQWAIKSGGEGLEEVISGTFSAIGKKLTYMKDEDFKKILKDEKLLDQFISGAISAGISSGTGMIKSTKSGQDYISGRTNSEQQIYDRMIENKTNELKASKNNELKQKAIDDKVKEIIEQKKEKFKNAKIDEKAIRAEVENNIDFDDSTIKLSKKELAEINEAVDEAFEKGKLNLNDIYETFTPEETNKIARLEKELQNKNLTEEAKKGYEKELLETIKQRNETLTNESEKNMFLRHTLYNEEQRATNFELTKEEKKLVESDEKLKNLYDDAVKYGNNSEEAHKFVNALAKMSKQTEYQYRLTDTKELNQLGYKVSNKDAVINGLHDGDNKTIYINMDSDNALNVVVGHETGHIFENTQEYKELQEMLFKVAEEDGTLEARRAELKELYKNVKNANIDVELTNDLLGEKLFTDEKFIERLAEKPNLFTKIKDKIDDLVIQFKGTEEEKELRKIQNKFLEVYRKNNLQEYVAEADAKAKKTNGVELSLKLNGYNPEIDISTPDEIKKFNIKNYNNHNEVIKKVLNNLKETYLSTNEISKPIKNIDTGMEIEIRQGGIRETFGNPDFYDALSQDMKKAKISTIPYLAKMVKFGEVRSPEAKNYHNNNSKVTYAYLKYPITIDGNDYIVNLDIRKSPNGENRFYIHSLDIKKEANLSSSQSELLKDKSTSMSNNIPQSEQKIKSTKADYSLSAKDNKGRTLTTKEQQELKNTQARDNDGKILELYHGTNYNFEVFDRGSGEHGEGFYFTEDINYADEFATEENGRVIKSYLNIENPLSQNIDLNNKSVQKFISEIENRWGLSKEEILKCFENNNEEWSSDLGAKIAEKMGYGKSDVEDTIGFDIESPEDFGITDYNAYLSAYAWNDGLNDLARECGFDGIISRTYNSDSNGYEYIAFKPNQIYEIKDDNNLAPIKTNNLNEYIADVSAREAKQNELNRESVRQSIIDYLEENNITNPTKEDMMNAFDDYDVMDNSDTLNDANKAEKLYSEVADEILKENNSKYSLSKNNNTELNNYLEKNNFKLDDNGSLEYKELSNKQINSLVSIYKKNGYSDVSADYLRERLKESGRLKIPREVADRFIEKELGYKPEIDTTKVFEDAEGNKLTKNQVEFYKDSDVRDIRGRLIPVYHRTNAEFTIFDKKAGKQHGNKYGRGFYFSINPENYGNNEMKVYLNAKDGEYKYIPDMGYYIVQEPNMIKNVDNLNPTSNEDIRYSISKKGKLVDNKGNDVRLDVSDVGNTGTLMAMHNLNAEKLNGIIDLGGFPVPSIAITTTENVGSNQFGNISVLFNKDTIDPANRLNEVYDRDVWTPTFPKVEYDIDNEMIRKMSKNNHIYDDNDDGIISHARLNYMYSDNLTDLIDRRGLAGTLDKMKDDNELKYLYLKTKDNDYKPQMKPKKYSDDYTNRTLQNFIDNFKWGEMELPDFYYHYLNYGDMDLTDDQRKALKMSVRDAILPEIKQEAKEEYKKALEKNKNGKLSENDFVEKYINMMLENFDESYFKYIDFIRDASRLYEFGETETIDENKTLEQASKDINQKEYEKWIDDTFGNMIKNATKGIRNDKDLFTASGNRRSFNQLHEKYDLENIVKYMTSQKTIAGEKGFGVGSGFGTIQAQMSNRFNTLDDIRNSAKEKIVPNTQEQDLIKPYSEKIYNDMEELIEYYKYKNEKYSYPMDSVGYALNDYAGLKKHDITNLKKILNEYQFEIDKIPEKILNKVVDDINSLKNIPTDYFEAKPQRAVRLDEIQSVVLPTSTDESLKNKLKELNIDYVEYNPEIEGDKQRVINQFDNLKFSLSRKNNLAPIRGDYQVYSKDIRNNNLAPIREDITKKPASKNVNYSLLEEPAESEVDYSAFDDMLPIKNELERLDAKEEERLRKKREKYQQQIEQAKKVSKQKKSEFRKNYDNFKTLFINENAEVDNLAKESGNKKLTYKADMLNNYVVEAENDINNYQTDYNGKEIGKSVKQLFEPAKNKGLYEAFNDYLINYSNIDRHKQGKGSLRWESTSQDLINQYEKKYPEFKKWGKDVWQYGKNALNTMEQAGLIDSKLKERLTEMYPHYVPFMDNADLNMYIGTNDEIVPKKTIKSAKGGMSTTEMLPMEDALTRYAYSYRKSMRQNDLYSEIVKTLRANEIDTGMDVREEATDLQDSLYRDENGNYLKAYIDGDTKVVSISNDLYRALQNDLKNQVKDLEDRLSLITKPLQKATRIKGNLVTSWSPTFIFKNFFKDFQDAMFNSTDTKKFIKNYPSAFNELRKNDTKLVRQFRAMYGSAVGQYTGSDTGAMKQATKTKNPFKKFANANEIIELAPRYAEFKASLENGATIEEAMYNAREVTTNFSRGGTITKAINRNGFNFVNASTQGLSKFIRNFTGQNGAKGFTHALLKAVEFGVAPALFNELVFGSGDDKDEDYDALPDYVKDNYYLFKYGDNKFIRIPKGRALSVFGSGARRTLEYINGEKDAFDGYGTNVWNQIGINNPEESFLFTPIMQAKSNKAWYGGDIVPTRLQDKPAGEQYDEKTDAFSKWLGKTLNVSPKKINYVIDQYSGGLGDIALPFITPEAQSEYDNPAGRALAPIRDQFVVNSIDDNKYVSDFYTNNDKLKVQANSEYATDEDALRYKYSNSVSSELSALYKEKRLIQNDSSLSNSEKYKKAQAIKQQINEIAKEGLDNYKKVNVVGNYAEVNDKEYYRNNKGEWTKAKEEDIEEMNKFGLTANEKNNYYNSKNNISNITSRYKSLSENATDEEKTQLSTLKKNDIINTIKATNISNDAKAYLYSKYYSSADKMNVISTLDISMDKYLDFELQNFKADKNIYGQTIKNSKKTKMINYINNMSGTYGEKIIIYKLNNMSDDSYNKDIVNYINNQNISMEEKRTLLKALGMKVDYAGNVRW